MQSKRRFQISIRMAMLVIAFVAFVIALWVNFRETIYFSYTRYDCRPALIVPENFDLQKLGTLINSPEFPLELAKENPKHRRLIEEMWIETSSGVEFQYVDPRSFQMVVTYPGYEVRHRRLGWSGIETTYTRLGDSKLAQEVRGKGEDLKAVVLRKIYGYVNDLASGEFKTSPKSHSKYVPKGASQVY